MFQIEFCKITREATIARDGREIGIASFANSAQSRLFQEEMAAGSCPAQAAEDSGAIFVPSEQ